MKKGLVIGVAIGIVVIIAIVYFAMNSGTKMPAANMPVANNPSPSNTPSNAPANTPSSSGNSVTIQNFAFSPATLNIKVGDTVVWTNQDSAPHKIASDSGNELSSDSLSKGGEYSHTFTSAGTYDYHCAIHTSMKGKVIVS